MKVLMISPQFPAPPRSGFTMRVYQLARQLALRHDVTLLSYASAEEQRDVADLTDRGIRVEVIERQEASHAAKRVAQARSALSSQPFSCRAIRSEQMQDAIDGLCASEHFDVVHLESSMLCTFAFPPGVRLVLDEHNIEYELFRRMCEGERSLGRRSFNRLEYRRFRRFEQVSWKRVDGCVVTSEREQPTILASAPATPIAVVPNGVDLEYFRGSGIVAEPYTVVFNGILTYRPNVDAAYHLVEDVWPLVRERCPRAELTIAGRSYAADARRLRRSGVTLTGEVPDVRPYLERAAVVAVPVRIGGGTRLKVVEGLSMGKAMVSTSLGCEGVAVRNGEHLLIRDRAAEFAGAIAELFEDDPLRRDLGRAGRRLVEREYSWDLAGERLEALYGRIGIEEQAPAKAPTGAGAFAIAPARRGP
jgi:glycosyltransferase involved in cell wall biosynthesis